MVLAFFFANHTIRRAIRDARRGFRAVGPLFEGGMKLMMPMMSPGPIARTYTHTTAAHTHAHSSCFGAHLFRSPFDTERLLLMMLMLKQQRQSKSKKKGASDYDQQSPRVVDDNEDADGDDRNKINGKACVCSVGK